MEKTKTALNTKDAQRGGNWPRLKDGSIDYSNGRQEDRMFPYSLWHRHELGSKECVQDLDQVEYRFDKEGNIIPVTILEVTRMDVGWENRDPNETYLKNIEHRFFNRDAQARAIQHLARMLRVKAWIVLFRGDLQAFWVFDIRARGPWHRLTDAQYKRWIQLQPGTEGKREPSSNES